jgi:non-canonical poly(A) RNA polymerase PAPD5/7
MKMTSTGGIGSFMLQMMILSHLQHHPCLREVGKSHVTRGTPQDEHINLGCLLHAFFELYGKQFNYQSVGLSVRDGGSYFAKVCSYPSIDVTSPDHGCTL